LLAHASHASLWQVGVAPLHVLSSIHSTHIFDVVSHTPVAHVWPGTVQSVPPPAGTHSPMSQTIEASLQSASMDLLALRRPYRSTHSTASAANPQRAHDPCRSTRFRSLTLDAAP